MNPSPAFFVAPHRVMFLSGLVQALLAMLFWIAELGARHLGIGPAPAWPLLASFPASWLHALSMLAGVFPFFVFGFILTAGPRWQGAGDLAQRHFLPAFALLAGGWLLVWASLLLPFLLLPGLAFVLSGWVVVAVTLTQVAARPGIEREHICAVAVATWLGAAGVVACLLAIDHGAEWMQRGITLVLWGFLLPVFITVAHRMLPFFTASATRGYVLHRPAWALRVLLVASLGHGALTLAELPQWRWLADFPAAGTAVYLSWLWWSRSAIDNRMLAVLHVSFAWLAPAFIFFAVQSVTWALSPGFAGQAPLHALALGFFASMLVGMVTRVTLGHSGRPVAADSTMWRAFLIMQAAAAVRIAGEVLAFAAWLNTVAALLWLLAFAIWAVRYAPAFWRPRADGKPG